MADSRLKNAHGVVLVADVGGTNCRFALGRGGKVLADTTATYRNADHADFYAALANYLDQQGHPVVSKCCIAIAGPVTGTAGALTNLDWQFDAARIQRLTGSGHTVLLNDLAALGYALDGLSPQETLALNPHGSAANANGQSLIVGAGTGLNGCAVLSDRVSQPVVLRAEIGHSSMPVCLAKYLSDQSIAGDFATVESFFCGTRLALLYTELGGASGTDPRKIIQRLAKDPAAKCAVEHMQHMFGLLCRELSYLYLPMDGIFLAGSVARGVLGCGTTAAFLSAFQKQGKFGTEMATIPVSLLTRDETALTGCMRAVSVDQAPLMRNSVA